jgi:hypothetical protein
VPIHVIGGISFDATGAETRGFVDTVRERDVIGASYYTSPDHGEAVEGLRAIGSAKPAKVKPPSTMRRAETRLIVD